MNFASLLTILVLFSGVLAGGNYLDNYFCTNEICNSYWQDCPDNDQSLYCTGRAGFFACVDAITSTSAEEKTAAYNACRTPISYANSGNYFYFLNCQINCGYETLWVACSQQLNTISSCTTAACTQYNDQVLWSNHYQACALLGNADICSQIFFSTGTAPLTMDDCKNSVKAKCKEEATNSVGSSNTYVQLMMCSSYSGMLAAAGGFILLSIAMLSF